MPEQLPEELVQVRDKIKGFIEHDLAGLELQLKEESDTEERGAILETVREQSRQMGLFYQTQPEE